MSLSRRSFLARSGPVVVSSALVHRLAWGANDRLQVGCIGIGGKGASDVSGVAGAGAAIVALCDVDENRRGKKGKGAQDLHADAAFYKDFRVMLEKEGKNLDAVTVSTPDHVHAAASILAMRLGKHVYCQKPLAHSVWEARRMAEVAVQAKVATQMGNQAHAGEPIRRAVEWVRAGLLGKVREVHAWTNRPIWPQGMTARPAAEPVPEGLEWDLWLGPAPERPYNAAYCPFKWRGWWDFGTGALGDMGCHIMDMPFWALDLKHPVSVEAEAEGNTPESGPKASTVTYRFPAGTYCEALTYVWYDGNRMPPAEVIADAGVPEKEVAKKFDLVMVGEKGKLFFQRGNTSWATSPKSLLDEFKAPAPTIPRVKDEDVEWVQACTGGPAALSNFALAGPFTEQILLGNLAVRLGRKIEWDGVNLKATNAPEADALIRRAYRKGWEPT